MNLAVIVALTVWVLIEKWLPLGDKAARASGLVSARPLPRGWRPVDGRLRAAPSERGVLRVVATDASDHETPSADTLLSIARAR
jgi:hypothetical protein